MELVISMYRLHMDWYIDGQNCRLAWPGTGLIKAWPDEARPTWWAPINYCLIVSVLVDQYASPTFFYNLAFLVKISHLYTARRKTIFRPWTRLCDLQRRGNTSRRHRSRHRGRRSWLAWLATLALTWPEVGVMIHGADLGAVNRGADL